MSGDTIYTFKQLMQKSNASEFNLKIATIVVNKIAFESKKTPDYYAHKSFDTSFYFPWGKAK